MILTLLLKYHMFLGYVLLYDKVITSIFQWLHIEIVCIVDGIISESAKVQNVLIKKLKSSSR